MWNQEFCPPNIITAALWTLTLWYLRELWILIYNHSQYVPWFNIYYHRFYHIFQYLFHHCLHVHHLWTSNLSQTLYLNRFFLNSICHTICRYIRLLSKVCVTKVTSKQILFHKYYNNVGSCSIKYISFIVNIVWILKCTVTFDLFSNVVSPK